MLDVEKTIVNQNAIPGLFGVNQRFLVSSIICFIRLLGRNENGAW